MSPLARGSSIAVLGGGVSGLTFAHEMRKRGFSNVVVFERAARAGGKCCTVEIDGEPHDLGATMGVPIDYKHVLGASRRASIQTEPFPQERHYSLKTGREVPLNRWSEMPAVLAQAARYGALHLFSWSGVSDSKLHRAPSSLYFPWSKMVEQHGLHDVSRRTLAYRTGYGYGFDDEVPAVMFANLFRPQTFLALMMKPSIMWRGGTQPIWTSLAKDLDVRCGVTVEHIRRDADGVRLQIRSETETREARFDALVVTLNPQHALPLLDASPEEKSWFSSIVSYPYATFACEVDGLTKGIKSVGYIDDNMVRNRPGHPMAWVKRYAHRNIFVFHLFAPPELSESDCLARIAGDVSTLGGKLVRLRESRRWEFFPHFSSELMRKGGLQQIERWQGATRTYLIGEALSFATMARTAELATNLAQRLAAA